METHRFKGADVLESIQAIKPNVGDLAKMFAGNTGPIVNKWHHYIPIYDRYFSRFRGTDFKFLEIGVFKGGSLKLWREFFGPKATIFGIDIDEDCAKFDGDHAQVRIGSQDDPEFLRSVIEEMGGVDLVLDDGSHHMGHLKTSLETLFPLLSDNGLYALEDLHTAYWPQFGGGLGSKANFFQYVTSVIDDMHSWYYERDRAAVGVGDLVSSMHIHDSIMFLEKAGVTRPTWSKVGVDA